MQNYFYLTALCSFLTGLFLMLVSDNLIRKLIGLSVFQAAILIFYLALGKVNNGIVPIDLCRSDLQSCSYNFSSPLPHVLMLTAIVVGFATLAVGLALTLQLKKNYGTILESNIRKIESID